MRWGVNVRLRGPLRITGLYPGGGKGLADAEIYPALGRERLLCGCRLYPALEKGVASFIWMQLCINVRKELLGCTAISSVRRKEVATVSDISALGETVALRMLDISALEKRVAGMPAISALGGKVASRMPAIN
ncbi:hypothetical protein AVEN_260946-1 [Araneus ventricosus]|uniref:Uncharacterized protein n=1 Tax=Araneus ventricosus TaxID=182803 RepID=A0A4Y2KGX7_ARAVE|nr:hypothetical protein AVEN_260946-1 [Araneus ventricosus]